MLNNRSSKEKRNTRSSNGTTSFGRIRLQDDLKYLEINGRCNLYFPNKDDLMHFEVTLCQEEGFYREAYIVFSITVPDNYPHSAPKVKCLTRILHPNIDMNGNVCLNILRNDWSPVLSINSILFGLQYLLNEPTTEDALNESAAKLLTQNIQDFEAMVKSTLQMAGAYRKKK